MQTKAESTRFVWNQQRADGLLAFVSAAWGSSYLLMKIGLNGIPPFCLIAFRFGIAFLVVAALAFKKMKKTSKRSKRSIMARIPIQF